MWLWTLSSPVTAAYSSTFSSTGQTDWWRIAQVVRGSFEADQAHPHGVKRDQEAVAVERKDLIRQGVPGPRARLLESQGGEIQVQLGCQRLAHGEIGDDK